MQLKQPCLLCRVTQVEMDLLGQLDSLEKRWGSLIQPPSKYWTWTCSFHSCWCCCSHIGWTRGPRRRRETRRQRSNGELPLHSLLSVFPLYVHVHVRDCCITYFIHFQGETGKQGPVGPAGPPGIIVRHSIFNVFGFLYSFSISICRNLTSFLV